MWSERSSLKLYSKDSNTNSSYSTTTIRGRYTRPSLLTNLGAREIRRDAHFERIGIILAFKLVDLCIHTRTQLVVQIDLGLGERDLIDHEAHTALRDDVRDAVPDL